MKSEYSEEDFKRGWLWYTQHKNHVDEICKGETKEFPMSGSDIGRPELWKPGAWLWFFRHQPHSVNQR